MLLPGWNFHQLRQPSSRQVAETAAACLNLIESPISLFRMAHIDLFISSKGRENMNKSIYDAHTHTIYTFFILSISQVYMKLK